MKRTVLERVQVNMPYLMLVEKYLPMILRERINPEIGFNCFVLDRFRRDEFAETASRLRDAGLTITFHAPFFDLRPGAIDGRIREVTIDRLNQVFDLVPLFRPVTVVCHASFDERYYVSNEELWLENSRDTWNHFLGRAAEMNTVVALENVYEQDPVWLGRLFDSLERSSPFCFCFDTGHFNVFSEAPLTEWLDRLGQYLGQLHLHDNDGKKDEHQPVGEGSFPFPDLFDYLAARDMQPVITLEPHEVSTFRRTVKNLETMNMPTAAE